ncbi:MAG: site-specific integrase [Methanoregula sp.]|nr:MAG: site-specific integrase [Methanoregula sp.]
MKEIIADPALFRNETPKKIEQYLIDQIDKGIITSDDNVLISKYIKARAASSATPHTIHGIAVILVKMRRYIPIEYRKITIEKLQEGITALNTSKISDSSKVHPGRTYKPNTRINYINELKGFLKWSSEKGFNKLKVSDIESIKAPKADSQTFGPQDILKKEEIEAVIRACDNVRDMAFISALYDGGFRAIELSTMEWGDLHWSESEEHKERFIVVAHTNKKTGTPRRVMLTRSGAFLNDWKNQYRSYTGAEPEGENVIFVSRDGKPWSYNTGHKLILKLRKKVKEQGIDLDKKLKLHQFRRANITHESDDKRPISHICKEKWGKSYSPMILRYNQPGDEAIDDSKCEVSGVPTKRKYVKREKVLEPVVCPNPKCGFVNKPLNDYCARCGAALSEEARRQHEAKIKIIDKTITESDEKLKEEIVREVLKRLK